jgi:hypothetical protein
MIGGKNMVYFLMFKRKSKPNTVWYVGLESNASTSLNDLKPFKTIKSAKTFLSSWNTDISLNSSYKTSSGFTLGFAGFVNDVTIPYSAWNGQTTRHLYPNGSWIPNSDVYDIEVAEFGLVFTRVV